MWIFLKKVVSSPTFRRVVAAVVMVIVESIDRDSRRTRR